MEVFGLLKDRGIIDWVPADSAYSDGRGTYLSGLFGVVKPGKHTENHIPVLRIFMNLVPVNGLFEVLRGDINCLPNATQWLPLCFSGGEEVNLSQGGMSSAFYLFSIPPTWRPFMCFNFQATGAVIGDSKLDPSWYRPTCIVLPMSWSSSVGIMQAVSRELLLSQGLPENSELKKGSVLLQWFTQVAAASSPSRTWWQIYLDNFLVAQFKDMTRHWVGLEQTKCCRG